MKLHVSTVRRLAKNGKLPATKYGRQLRFDRDTLAHHAVRASRRGPAADRRRLA